MGVLTRKKKKQDKLPATRKTPVVKIVHPHRYIEVYREPIPAGEIMRRYPRYCIARPDVFEFPWIVVRPETVLVPGKVFYLVPYTTLDRLLKEKRQQLESLNLSSKHSYFQKGSPLKALEWVKPSCDKQQNGYYNLQSQQYQSYELSCCNDTQGQDLDSGSYYKQSFYRTWDKVRRNLQSPSRLDSFNRLDLGLDSPLFEATRGRYNTNIEPSDSRLKSCLRKPNTEKKRLNLKVHFAASIVITESRRGSPSVR